MAYILGFSILAVPFGAIKSNYTKTADYFTILVTELLPYFKFFKERNQMDSQFQHDDRNIQRAKFTQHFLRNRG